MKDLIIGSDNSCKIVFNNPTVDARHIGVVIKKNQVKITNLSNRSETILLRGSNTYEFSFNETIIVLREDIIRLGTIEILIKDIIKYMRNKSKKNKNNFKR